MSPTSSETGQRRIAVLIVTWNPGEELIAAVESAMNQLTADGQVIIWDNASGPECERLFERLLSKFPTGLIIHRSDENLGFAGGNNQAAGLAGPVDSLLLLNPDAALQPGCLDEMASVLEQHPDLAAVGCTQLSGDGQIIDGLGDAYHASGHAWRKGYGKSVSTGLPTERITASFSPCGAVSLYRAQAFSEAEGFDADFFCFFEDVDLAFRLRLQGWQFCQANLAIAHHIGGVSAKPGSATAAYYGHRNMTLTFVKSMPTGLLLALLPMHLLVSTAALIRYSLRGQPGVILQAKRDALRALPSLLAKRATVMRKRVATTSQVWRWLDKSPLARARLGS